MRKFYSFIMVIIFWLLYAVPGLAQSIINQSAKVLDDNDLVQIKYTLTGQKGDLYNVAVYGSHDNFAKPLISVTGDVGSGIEVGGEKTILWQPKTELEKFAGRISFEIKAELSSAPIVITNPGTSSVFKRGKALNIAWNGGAKQETFYVHLLKDGMEKLNVDTVTINNLYNNKISWKIPMRVIKDDDYQIRIISADRSNVFKLSPSFTIKPRFPLVIKCIPVAAGLVAATIMLWSKQLPGPPDAPR